jgi:hypothetical protein
MVNNVPNMLANHMLLALAETLPIQIAWQVVQ